MKKVERMRRKEAGVKREKSPVQEGVDVIAEKMERHQKTVSLHLWNPTFAEENHLTIADSYDD